MTAGRRGAHGTLLRSIMNHVSELARRFDARSSERERRHFRPPKSLCSELARRTANPSPFVPPPLPPPSAIAPLLALGLALPVGLGVVGLEPPEARREVPSADEPPSGEMDEVSSPPACASSSSSSPWTSYNSHVTVM